jgi:hypothetical protein
MDIAPPNQHPATSDDELAKVLAGIGADDSPDHPAPHPTGQSAAEAAGLQFEETPGPMTPTGSTNANSPVTPQPNPRPMSTPDPAVAAPVVTPANAGVATAAPAVGNLNELKKTALEELRPLVGKLGLPPEDKFDTLLLIIRSTDDQTLLEPAHEAARAISDETKRAQALLDVIKEIDYFGQGQQQTA